MLKANFRQLKDEDIHFVVDAWFKSFSDDEKALRITTCKEMHKALILSCITKYKTIIACNPEDNDQIFGFVNYFISDNCFVTNYVYVKHPFRCFNLATTMLKQAGIEDCKERISTHSTYCFYKFCMSRKWQHFSYPYLIFKEMF